MILDLQKTSILANTIQIKCDQVSISITREDSRLRLEGLRALTVLNSKPGLKTPGHWPHGAVRNSPADRQPQDEERGCRNAWDHKCQRWRREVSEPGCSHSHLGEPRLHEVAKLGSAHRTSDSQLGAPSISSLC